MTGKRTTWIILGVMAVVGVVAMLTGHENFANLMLGGFIAFAQRLFEK